MHLLYDSGGLNNYHCVNFTSELERLSCMAIPVAPFSSPQHIIVLDIIFQVQFKKWRRGRTAPKEMVAGYGTAVVHGNTAYFSQHYSMYSYTIASDEWTVLKKCEYLWFGLAVVNNKVTAIGGSHGDKTTSNLYSLENGGTKWRKLLPPMPTARNSPATVTTPTHLIVAGGNAKYVSLPTVEILDTSSLQWSSASSSPEALESPHLSLCGKHLYLSQNDTIFSCSVEELLESCKTASTKRSDGDSVWAELANIPVPYNTSLTTLRGQVLAIGGRDQPDGGTPTGAIHSYNRSTNLWSVIGEMPTPRCGPVLAVLPSNELMVVGGWDGAREQYNITEIASTD